jgi:hypothetical protein
MMLMRSSLYLFMLVFALGVVTIVYASVDDPTRPMFLKKAVSVKKKPAKKTVKRELVSEKYYLSSTLVSKDRNVAVINNRSVMVGDKIGRATVIAIQPSWVRLLADGRKITLQLSASQIKRNRILLRDTMSNEK